MTPQDIKGRRPFADLPAFLLPGHFKHDKMVKKFLVGVVVVIAFRAAYVKIDLQRGRIHGSGLSGLKQKITHRCRAQ
jgi:hypothetical protein